MLNIIGIIILLVVVLITRFLPQLTFQEHLVILSYVLRDDKDEVKCRNFVVFNRKTGKIIR